MTHPSDEPSQLGRYRIEGPHIRGGMGLVYQAYDPQVDRHVAIKIIPFERSADTDQSRRRFHREVEALTTLEHCAIVPVYDFGEGDDYLYFVMRFMTGGSLAERLRAGSLPLIDVVKVIDRIGGALDEVHRCGILHRDIKPGNILFDQDGCAYLADFGLVKPMDHASTLTSQNVLVGTPAYMSPEQVQGLRPLDGRSDLYSLGAVLFQMLTGQPPFTGETGMNLAVQHILQPVPNILDVRPDLPPAMRLVIGKALAKTPEQRYQTAAEMIEDLYCILADQPPIHADSPSTGKLPRPILSRAVLGLQVWVWLAILALLAALASTGLYWASQRESASQLPPAAATDAIQESSDPPVIIITTTPGQPIVVTATPGAASPAAPSLTPTATAGVFRPAPSSTPAPPTPDPGGSTGGGTTGGETTGGATGGDSGGLVDDGLTDGLVGGLVDG